jgi:hypothetical protein
MPSYRLFFPIEVRFRDLDALGHVNDEPFTGMLLLGQEYWTSFVDLSGPESKRLLL